MFLALLFSFFVHSPAAPSFQPADTLRAGVFHVPDSTTTVGKVLVGATRDLSALKVLAITLRPGKSYAVSPGGPADRLLIVGKGHVTVDIDRSSKLLGPGGIALSTAAYDKLTVHNAGSSGSQFYVFSFRSRSDAHAKGATPLASPLLVDWPELVMKKTDKGESRAIFGRPTASLSNLNMHATTLDPGRISHPQHVHRNEEIILMRSGHVRMHIADRYQTAEAGDLVFLPSGVPHNLENGNDGRCEYFALQWSQ